MMVAKVMLNSGYKLDSGLGQNWQGRLEPIQVNDNKGPQGLGFNPPKGQTARACSSLAARLVALVA